jgi:hypothetical protein
VSSMSKKIPDSPLTTSGSISRIDFIEKERQPPVHSPKQHPLPPGYGLCRKSMYRA